MPAVQRPPDDVRNVKEVWKNGEDRLTHKFGQLRMGWLARKDGLTVKEYANARCVSKLDRQPLIELLVVLPDGMI